MDNILHRRLILLGVLLPALVASIFLIVFGHYGFPLPQQDAMDYIPPAINYAAGKGLVNEVSSTSYFADPTGQARFLYYPPLFQIVLGRLMWHADVITAFTVIGLLDS